MRKYFLGALTGVIFAFLVGCQSTATNGFFSSGNSSQNLQSSVNTAFKASPELAAVPIHIEVQNRTVFLSGYVKTIRQSDTAGEVAARCPALSLYRMG